MAKKLKFTPLTAIKMKCLNCQGFNKMGVRRCGHQNCPNFPYRLGNNPNRKGIDNGIMTKNNHGLEKSLIESIKNRQNKADNTLIPRPLSTIRQECLDCCLDQPGEVSFCPALECPFYLFRFGRRPTDKEISQFLIDCHEPEILNEAYIDLATQVKKILNSVKENK